MLKEIAQERKEALKEIEARWLAAAKQKETAWQRMQAANRLIAMQP